MTANDAGTDADILTAGTLLGAYRIVRCIGYGGMGAVYEAQHCTLQKRVALKVPFRASSTEEGRARFVLEGKMAARIRHPNVVDVTDVGETDDVAYLVMEYLEGQPLSELIDSDGPLNPRLIADIFVPVAAALQEAHRMGVVHCDLKPENIFVTRSVHGGIQPKVLDFGISKALHESESGHLTPTNALLGTPQYLSPEQLQSGATAKSDQYMLGVVMYEAATGVQPFADRSPLLNLINAIGTGERKRAKEAYPEIDVQLAAIIERAMCIAPNRRFLSMTSLGAQLLSLASSETIHLWARHFGAPVLASATSVSALQKLARWIVASGIALLFCSFVLWSVTRRQSPLNTSLRAPVNQVPRVVDASAPLLALPAGRDTTPEQPRSREPEMRELGETMAARLPQPADVKPRVANPPPVKRTSRSGDNAAAVSTRRLTAHMEFKPNPHRVEAEPGSAKPDGATGNEPLPTDNIDPWQP